MIDTKKNICDLYSNLIMMSILRQRDFEKLVAESEAEMKEISDDKTSYFPKGYEGLYFIELIANKMGSTLGEVYSLSRERKEEIILSIIDKMKKSKAKYDILVDSNSKCVEFESSFHIMDSSDEEKIIFYIYSIANGVEMSKYNIYVHYRIIFQKNNLENGAEYMVWITGTHDFKSDYVYDEYEIWSGKNGPIVDFIEDVIDEHKCEYESSNNTENTSVESKDENDIDVWKKYSKHTDVLPETIEKDEPINVEYVKHLDESEKNEPKIIDELIRYISEDTRTIDLLDLFEGYGQKDSIKYKRIVVKNSKYWNYSKKIGFNLVIERGRGSDYIGDTTFTKFKKDEAVGLYNYVKEEITEEIIDKYVDTDKIYYFSKPYLLRAQNTSNRTGYGWEWDWSGGIGSYTEGTLYGETTNYFFVGVYITSDDFYDPKKRKAFV